MPSIFILQEGGILNAFATRCSGKEYVAIYSSVLELAYEKGQGVVSFIIGHELGHIKRNHAIKNLLLFPSLIIPFLPAGYSRACEYTCDNIGHALSPLGSRDGILVLSVGKSLFNKVNVDGYLQQIESEGGFWVWFSELIRSHPNHPKRIKSLSAE
jgi:Zn-dependent protease with chaperone function